MALSHTAALAAVKALKKRGLIVAMDAASEEEGARIISQQGDRPMRRTRMGDAEMQERQREEMCRDALRRAADAETLDPDEIEDVIEAIASNYPEILAKIQHEIHDSADHRGPAGWARDRAERRAAEDSLRAKDARRRARDVMKPRRMGASDDPPPFEGMPETGGGMFHGRDWEENGHGVPPGEDRRRTRAFDIALDQGDDAGAFAAWLPGAASIGKI